MKKCPKCKSRCELLVPKACEMQFVGEFVEVCKKRCGYIRKLTNANLNKQQNNPNPKRTKRT